MISKHEQVRRFYEADASDYQRHRWFGNAVAQADYCMTGDALLDALRPHEAERILEVGCGPGTWTRVVSARCRTLTAIDISEKMIQSARGYAQASNITFVCSDFMLFTTMERYDKVFAVRVFEHFQDKAEFLHHSRELLKPGGQFVLITKTIPSIWNGRVSINRTMRRLFRRPVATYPHSTDFWMKRVSPWKVRRLLSRAGFENVDVVPVVLRLPIFARGEDEYPLLRPPLEETALRWSLSVARCVWRAPSYLRRWAIVFSESYLASGYARC
jgi:2-polyprenyl-3-methyl-5-hydroxy-6-metoxy-1,4-benzoquinol methylase